MSLLFSFEIAMMIPQAAAAFSPRSSPCSAFIYIKLPSPQRWIKSQHSPVAFLYLPAAQFPVVVTTSNSRVCVCRVKKQRPIRIVNASRKLRGALFTLIHGDSVECCFRQELEAQSSYSGVAEWCTNESTWHCWKEKKKYWLRLIILLKPRKTAQ